MAAAGPADADAAVAAAWNAFHAWSRTTYDEKRRILLRAADLLGQRAAGSGQRAAGSGQPSITTLWPLRSVPCAHGPR
ncbi:aldehyde dehydrogenase family protein [Streptomyces pluripotens]|uniref:aldehyde dehydrogenase family protein n=1 Tax=Streptomyces pluripotens TaxID=1355015 RepID=UPI003CC81C7B